jgi:hypothetical protein
MYQDMNIEEIKTKEQLKEYMAHYGQHVDICFGDYYHISRANYYDTCYRIGRYKEKHRGNWYNDSLVEEKEFRLDECFKLIKKEVRKKKLDKLNEKVFDY